MTAGQGSGPDGGQGGPPPYPSAPPPYPPPGQGYGPAPTAPAGWGQQAPQPVERPVTVRAGLGAFIASLVMSLVAGVVTMLNFDRFLAAALAAQPGGTADVPFDEERFAELVLRLSLIVGLVFLALYLLFLWFAWKGYNWARIVLWVLGGLEVVFGLGGLLAGQPSPLPVVGALRGFGLLFTAVGIVLLALKPSSDWYRYRGWLRTTGQGR